MGLARVVMLSAALALTLTPLATLAQTTPEHRQAELANGFAQWDDAQQQVIEIQDESNRAAQNERMIALLRSSAMRERQLNQLSNANAMEQLAAALANGARQEGDLNASNAIGIAQIRALVLVAKADANLANAMAQGRSDELANARAQWNMAHQLADFLTGPMLELNISNGKQIAEAKADAIHGQSIVEVTNAGAMAANGLFAQDLALRAGALAGVSASIGAGSKASKLLDHAQASLRNAKAQAGVSD
jgi:hypothetical protein